MYKKMATKVSEISIITINLLKGGGVKTVIKFTHQLDRISKLIIDINKLHEIGLKKCVI